MMSNLEKTADIGKYTVLKLDLPNPKFESSYRDYIDELGDEERYPFPLDFDHTDFLGMLDRIEGFRSGETVPVGMVSSSTFWLIDNNEILGCTNIRHTLNEQIEHAGGHIGLSIRPSYRGKGLGKILLNMSLNNARELGINEVHIHCHSTNSSSKAMIESCGGVLDSTVKVGDEEISRYLISPSRPTSTEGDL